MNCCGSCFNDSYLNDFVKQFSEENGTCYFCKKETVPIVSPASLLNHFELLFSTYQVSSDIDGKSSLMLLKEHWGLFQNLSDSVAIELLKHIFGTNDFNGIKLPDEEASKPSPVIKWKNLQKELKFRNRFFPELQLNLEHDGQIFGYLKAEADLLSKKVYRARIIKKGENPFGINDMGKPSPQKASNGRANPCGIPYLYVASDEATAIAEVRPQKGERVCVATFSMPDNIMFADLCNPQKTISPFILEENEIKLLRYYMPYLIQLGKELSKPILPYETNLEYLSSQYLCEFIKHCGFDGVIYNSSVGPGLNYAIFNDESICGETVASYEIIDVNLTFSKI